ncbi:MAG: sulfotransferase [bacterium]|nr:sulfotransferase [bacterium]
MSAWQQLQGPPIFVVGSPRSGTTWMRNIFRAHPQVAAPPELALFTIQNGVLGLLHKYHRKNAGFSKVMTRDEMISVIRSVVITLYEKFITPEHVYFVEKTPNQIQWMTVMKEVFPEARFILIMRDGRDVSVSARAAAKGWGAESMSGYGSSIARTAQDWKYNMEVGLAAAEVLKDDVLIVRYEEIRHDPFTHYRKMFDFCGIPYDEALLQQIHATTDFDLNHKPNERAFHRGGRVGDWVTHFTFLDALIFNWVAGKMLIRTGYEKSRFWMPSLVHQPKVLLTLFVNWLRRFDRVFQKSQRLKKRLSRLTVRRVINRIKRSFAR